MCVSDEIQCWLLGRIHTCHKLDEFASCSLSLPLQVFLDDAQFLLLCVRVLDVHVIGSLRFFHRMCGVLCWRSGDGCSAMVRGVYTATVAVGRSLSGDDCRRCGRCNIEAVWVIRLCVRFVGMCADRMAGVGEEG